MIANGKFGAVEPVLKYDITTYNYLFDGDNIIRATSHSYFENQREEFLPVTMTIQSLEWMLQS